MTTSTAGASPGPLPAMAAPSPVWRRREETLARRHGNGWQLTRMIYTPAQDVSKVAVKSSAFAEFTHAG